VQRVCTEPGNLRNDKYSDAGPGADADSGRGGDH
jgi:hypothetical protein